MSYRHLALGVIKQACDEAGDKRADRRVAARAFLASPDAEWWCAVAGLDASAVRRAVARSGGDV